ncbi:MAG TPA: MBL fold metallo-hydrolase [Roseimicrobium sp.]|nr:MBL fold metallo-hydrolase [Roseimicrobium sp.]
MIHSFRTLAVGIAFASLSLVGAFAQQDFSKVEIKVTQVSDHIYMLEGSGGNIAVSAGPDGVLIVDTQFAPLSPKIEAAIEKLGKGKAKYVLNTHWHGDHTGGNVNFGKYADIIANANVKKRLQSAAKPAPAEALPKITFDDKWTTKFNGEEIRMVHMGPGHTDGDSYVYFTGSKVIHMGDQFVNKRFPFIDLTSGGSVEGYAKNLGDVLKTVPADLKVIPGHGPLGTTDDIKTMQSMLQESVDLVKTSIKDGKTLEQIKAAGLPAKFKDWSGGFMGGDRWLQITYNSLTQK